MFGVRPAVGDLIKVCICTFNFFVNCLLKVKYFQTKVNSEIAFYLSST